MRKLALGAAALAVLTLLGGCARDPYYRDSYYTRDAVVGGLIGGATGAAIGNAVGGRQSTIVGGALGAAVGTAIATDPYRRPYYSDSYRYRQPYPYGNYPRYYNGDDCCYRSYGSGTWVH
jgi:uncharacterized protein YcfJ